MNFIARTTFRFFLLVAISVLPSSVFATLTSFTVSEIACSSYIRWSIGIEFELNHFVVERSLNGFEFDVMDTVATAEIVNGSSYEYVDQNEDAPDLVYYRIKLVYEDGDFIYTDLAASYPECEQPNPIRIAPNPSVGSYMKVFFDAQRAGMMQLIMIDMTGRIAFSRDIEAQEGANELEIEIARLPRGHYKLVLPQTGQQQAFIKD